MAVRAVSRQDFRQEPYAVVLQVRICAGDGGWPSFLPRPLYEIFIADIIGVN